MSEYDTIQFKDFLIAELKSKIESLEMSGSKLVYESRCMSYELAELRKDKERLDLLVVAVKSLFNFVRTKHKIPDEQEFSCPYFVAIHDQIRAIDAAMEDSQ